MVPKALRNRPKLQDGLRYYWDIFWELNEGRQLTEKGFPQVLSWSDLKNYTALAAIKSPEVLQAISRNVRIMDKVYVELRRKELVARMESEMRQASKSKSGHNLRR